MIDPKTLKPGDVVKLYGWQDGKDFEIMERWATVVKLYPKFVMLKFSAGYSETWSYDNLYFGLNGRRIPDSYIRAGVSRSTEQEGWRWSELYDYY